MPSINNSLNVRFTCISKTLNWPGFPSTNRDFEKYKSLKTHDLDVLLSLTGEEADLKSAYLAEWSAVSSWNPETRYGPTGTINGADAVLMINSAQTLIGIL